MFSALKERKKRRIYAIPENHSVLVFKLTPGPPLANLIYFDMVDTEGLSPKETMRIETLKRFLIMLRYSAPNYSLQVSSSNHTTSYLTSRDDYFSGKG